VSISAVCGFIDARNLLMMRPAGECMRSLKHVESVSLARRMKAQK
jgi:hypothetical protein